MSWDREFTKCGRCLGLAQSAAGPNIRGALLGKARRYAPDRDFDTVHLFLDLDISFARRCVTGECRTKIRPFQPGLRTLEFDAMNLKVSAATVDGRRARFTAKAGKLRLHLSKPLDCGREIEISVRYRIDRPKAGLHFVSPSRRAPRSPIQVWSQSQPEDARHWYPCHDSPQQKCTSEVRATVPKGFCVISNGVLIETGAAAGKTVWHWRMDRPHAIYLISIAAGRFSEISQRWKDVPVTFYCEKGREADARRGFGKTVKAMEFFSKATGVPYPYDKYAQVAAAEYPGGMEHTTCTTQTDACLIDERAALDNDLDLLVAHELAHQWFGDLVTCRDWSHAWLNEGFATYFEVLFQEHDKGRDEADYELLQNARLYFEEDSRRYRRPIVCSTFKSPWTLFDRHTYEKGSWVLHMLRGELGETAWGRVLRHYLEKHRDGSVETNDLIQAIADVTGRNLKAFFDQWVFRGGYPTIRVSYAWDAKARKAKLHIVETQDISDDAPAFRFKLPIRFIGRGWSKECTASVSAQEQRFSWPLAAAPIDVQVDPDFTVLKKLTLRKPHAMWLYQLRHAQRAQTRQAAAWRAAAWADGRTVDALEQAIRREPFWGAGGEMVRALGGMKTETAFRALARLLRIKHPKVRRIVVETLGQYKRAETGSLLAPLARSDDSILVEAEAARALGGLGQRRWLPLVKAALDKSSYRDLIGTGGVAGLAATRDPGVLKTLRRYSRPPHNFLRRAQAIKGLAEYAAVSQNALPWICEAAADPDERVTLAAVLSLGHLEDERALPTLEKLRKHPNTRVRVYAEEAIARIRAGLEPKAKTAS